MKDYFSIQSAEYAQFRPTYPAALYDYILSLLPEKHTAWDCATGNGQVARELAKSFREVFATDISENQLKNALLLPNITYIVEPAERTSFSDHTFDLITVAQAIHWFDFDAFYQEVTRTLKPGGIIAVIGYGLMHISPQIDAVVHSLYEGILGEFWDQERKYIEEHYLTIPFPFTEIKAPGFSIQASWTFEQLMGYLGTWSALQHYVRVNKENPLDLVFNALKQAWGAEASHEVDFPILLRLGSV